MNSQHKTNPHKMFRPLKDLNKYIDIVNTKESLLYECTLFLKNGDCEANAKIKFLRFYEHFILISACKTFVHFKIAEYGSHVSVNFKYEEKEGKTVLSSFELITENQVLEFFSSNHLDLLNVYRILKSKLNLQGFHDNFKAIKKIGRGNFAIVYLAQNNIDGQEYAVKAMNKLHLKKQKNGIASFENEVRILKSLDHPNLIHLDSVYETSNSFYIVMEILYGGNLKEYIRNSGVLSEKKAARLMKNVLKGVKFLHSHNIMHRDIKPENILFRTRNISEDLSVVLADMGLATFNDVEKYLFPRCGTPGFVAPEVASTPSPEDHYDLKCDMYSIGVTFYFILTARLPYPGLNDIIKENKDCIVDFNKSELYKKLSPEAKDLISKLVCPVDQRLNIDQALNHRFFRIYEQVKSENDCEDLCETIESSRRSNGFVLKNMEQFNTRKLSLNDKNLFSSSPVSSPLMKLSNALKNSKKERKTNEKSLTFVTLTPLLTGFVKTLKSIGLQNDEDCLVDDDENYPDVSMVTALNTSLFSNEFKLIKALK